MVLLESLIIFLVSLWSLGKCNEANIWHYDSVICCECVPFYGCQNGSHINRSLIEEVQQGYANSEATINKESCPNIIDVCCLTSENRHPLCNPFERPIIHDITRNSRKPCVCFNWQMCPLDLVVSDGLGLESPFLNKIGLESHSKCTEPTEVCCGFDEGDTSPPLAFSGRRFENHLPTDEPSTDTRHENPANPLSLRGSTETLPSGCSCVNRLLCNADGTINEDGVGIFEPRGRFKMENKCQDPKEVVCCSSSVSGEEPGKGSGQGSSIAIKNVQEINFYLLGFIVMVLV